MEINVIDSAFYSYIMSYRVTVYSKNGGAFHSLKFSVIGVHILSLTTSKCM